MFQLENEIEDAKITFNRLSVARDDLYNEILNALNDR